MVINLLKMRRQDIIFYVHSKIKNNFLCFLLKIGYKYYWNKLFHTILILLSLLRALCVFCINPIFSIYIETILDVYDYIV